MHGVGVTCGDVRPVLQVKVLDVLFAQRLDLICRTEVGIQILSGVRSHGIVRIFQRVDRLCIEVQRHREEEHQKTQHTRRNP